MRLDPSEGLFLSPVTIDFRVMIIAYDALSFGFRYVYLTVLTDVTLASSRDAFRVYVRIF